jgi:hypothetical protein
MLVLGMEYSFPRRGLSTFRCNERKTFIPVCFENDAITLPLFDARLIKKKL